ncbi:TetR/AcrR family transcriptional regulator [Roseovarius aestuariivivens]|uniref:TetR/AcrR family transcriptional regulator n=1 Tax=Roseovarius aestuariivivens TaxID=1888910 RepID=UPI001081FA6B|nr:TetR/AcrR family transcriptional regulator [Roseovarius aestuariivivens]
MTGRARPYDRDAALDAAMILFWQKGYHATSLKDLEAALSMKPGSIYAAFDSKQALFALSLERYFDRSMKALRAALRVAPSPLDALADHLRRTGQTPAEDPARCACMLVKTVLNATAEEAHLAEQARGYLEAMQEEMAQAFARARDLGELPDAADPQKLARRYQANVTQLRIEAHRGLPRAELAALAEEMAQEIEALRHG